MSSDDVRRLTAVTPVDPQDGAPADRPAETADRVAASVLAVPGVHDLHGGVLGEVATYLPGRRVNGVRLREDGTHVHLVLAWDAPVAITTAAVRDRVAEIVPGAVHVTVEDVAPPSAETVQVPSPRS